MKLFLKLGLILGLILAMMGVAVGAIILNAVPGSIWPLAALALAQALLATLAVRTAIGLE
jgi:hypothetical protein